MVQTVNVATLIVLLLILIGSLPHYLVELTGAVFQAARRLELFPAGVKSSGRFCPDQSFRLYYATLVVLTGFAMMG